MSEFTITMPDLPAFVGRMNGAESVVRDELGRATDRITLQGERLAKQNVTANGSVVTGHGRRSIAATPARWAGGVVSGAYGTATPYMERVEKGRGPVRARGRALRFRPKGSNQFIYRKSVGPAAAKPFLRPTLAQLRPTMQAEYRGALQRIIARLGGG